MSNLPQYIAEIKRLIGSDYMKEALQEIQQLLAGSPLFEEALLQQARYQDVIKATRQKDIQYDEGFREKTKIRKALLELLDELTKRSQGNQAVAAEVATFLEARTKANQATVAGHGNVIVQDTTNSTIHIHPGPKTLPKILGNSPFFPEVFLGRSEDLKAVHQKLFEQANLLLLVNGQGGIGKTTLAAEYFRTYMSTYHHLAWVFAERSLRDALLTLRIPLGLKMDPQLTADEQLKVLLARLAQLEAPCLLVIDNANTLADLQAHYMALRSCPNLRILLTTRITEFAQAQKHAITPLPDDDAKALFVKYYQKHKPQNDPLLFQLFEAIGKNTLVIELLAKSLTVLNRFETAYSLEDLVQDLQAKGLLGVQTRKVSIVYQAKNLTLREERPEAIISAMYDLGRLSEEGKKLLANFAVLPAENIPFSTLKTLLPAAGLSDTLQSLFQKGWLDFNEEEISFKISPVVQEIVQKKNPELLEDCRALLNSLNEKLLYEPVTGHFLHATYEEADIYSRYGEYLVEVIMEMENDLAILCGRIGRYHQTTGNLDQALTFHEKDLTLSKALYEAYPSNVSFKNGLAISCQNLGITHSALGNLDQALTFYENQTQLFETLYEAFPSNVSFKNGLAISYQNLGITHRALGNLDQALIFYEQYNSLEKALYDAYPSNVDFKNNLAISCQYLGTTHSALGNLDQALIFYEQYNSLKKALYDAYPSSVAFKNGLAISYQNLGNTHSALGNMDQALIFYEKDLALTKALYEAYPSNVEFKNGLAISYYKLGKLGEESGKIEAAIGFYQQAEVLLEALAGDFPSYAEFQRNLGIVKEVLAEIKSENSGG